MSDVLDNPIRPNQDGASVRPLWKRVGIMELNQHWGWLSERLKERYPTASERELRSHLMACMDDNDAFFICNDEAVGLFTIVRYPLQREHVEEQFCIGPDPMSTSGAVEKLYEPVGNWIRRLGIRDFHYMRFSDSTPVLARREARALEETTLRVKVMIMEDRRGS